MIGRAWQRYPCCSISRLTKTARTRIPAADSSGLQGQEMAIPRRKSLIWHSVAKATRIWSRCSGPIGTRRHTPPFTKRRGLEVAPFLSVDRSPCIADGSGQPSDSLAALELPRRDPEEHLVGPASAREQPVHVVNAFPREVRLHVRGHVLVDDRAVLVGLWVLGPLL